MAGGDYEALEVERRLAKRGSAGKQSSRGWGVVGGVGGVVAWATDPLVRTVVWTGSLILAW
jgi:hypothetical protein